MVTIPRLNAFDYERNNRQMRVDYLMNKIQPNNMKIMLQRAEKKTLRESETREVLQMVCNTSEDIMLRFAEYIDRLEPNSEFDSKILDEMDKMLEYANECIHDIGTTYQCRVNTFILKAEDYMRIGYVR